MKTELMITGAIICCLICALGGLNIGHKVGVESTWASLDESCHAIRLQVIENTQNTAIEANAAYYDPRTGEFTWREDIPPID